MFGLQPKDIEAIQQCFAKFPAIQKVVIYGSRAKGNYRTGSDIDLTIEDDEEFIFEDLLLLENILDDLLLPYKIDISLKRQIDNPNLIEHINHVGMVFYSK